MRIALRQRFRRYAWAAVPAVGLCAGAVVGHAYERPALATAARPAGHWVAAWAAGAQGPSASNLSGGGVHDQTIREIVLSNAGGTAVRVRLTNAFGSRPLEIGRASVGAQRSGAGLAPGATRPLTFSGQPAVQIPPGADALSDPVNLIVRPLSHLAVSVYLPAITGPLTEHLQARQVNYVAAGDRALQTAAAGFDTRTGSWYVLDGVDVLAPHSDRGTIVALGDSITDGVDSPVGADARWPNALQRRLVSAGAARLSVVDEGIGGNRLLNDSICCGVNAVARLWRDVLAQPGVTGLIVLEGINDIGFSNSTNPLTAPHTAVSALQIVDGYEQIIALAHAAHIRVYGATLTPFEGARYWTAGGEAKREAVNRWISDSGAFDGVIDFAAAVADPGHPERLRPAYDSGDHLHPSAAGYRAMAAAVSLPMLTGRG
jgi:lysophospholipase L1-like esterase